MASKRKRITSAGDMAALSRAMDKEVGKAVKRLLAEGWEITHTGSGHVLVRHPAHPHLSETLSLSPRSAYTSLQRLGKLERALAREEGR